MARVISFFPFQCFQPSVFDQPNSWWCHNLISRSLVPVQWLPSFITFLHLNFIICEIKDHGLCLWTPNFIDNWNLLGKYTKNTDSLFLTKFNQIWISGNSIHIFKTHPVDSNYHPHMVYGAVASALPGNLEIQLSISIPYPLNQKLGGGT